MKNKNLMLYLFGSGTSVIGDVMLTTVLSLYIIQETQSPKLFGSIIALSFLPRFIFSIFSGSIVDRLNKKKVMIYLDLLRGIALLGLLFLGDININVIIAIILGFAVVDTFFGPSAVALIPLAFKKDELSTVNSLDQSFKSTLQVLTPFIGTILFSMFGLKLIIFIDALTFFVSGISEIFINVAQETKTPTKKSLFEDMKEGYKVILADKKILSLTINGGLTHLFLYPFIEVGIISLLIITFKSPNEHYGIIKGAISVATILASFLALREKNKRSIGSHINLGILGMIISVLLFVPMVFSGFNSFLGQGKYIPVIYLSIGCFFMFFSFGYYVVFFRTFFQQEIDTKYIGRFISIFAMLVSVSRVIGTYVYGVLFDMNNIVLPIIILSIGMLLKLLVHIPFLGKDKDALSQEV